MSTNIFTKIDFCDWLVSEREKKGLSQRDVEKNSDGGISKGYIGFLETKAKQPGDLSLKKLIALSIGLQVPVCEVIDRALKAELERFNTVKMSSYNDFDEVVKSYIESLELEKDEEGDRIVEFPIEVASSDIFKNAKKIRRKDTEEIKKTEN